MKTENPPSLSERFNDIDKKMIDDHLKVILFREYNNFVTQEINPSMFVPCKLVEGKWEILIDPDKGYDFDKHNLVSAKKEYQEALDNVLFEGCKKFYVHNDEYIIRSKEGKTLYLSWTGRFKIIENILHLVTLTPKGKELAGFI